MKATIEAPKERMVVLEMTESDAKTLHSLAPNITQRAIREFGGGDHIAAKGDILFSKINTALSAIL